MTTTAALIATYTSTTDEGTTTLDIYSTGRGQFTYPAPHGAQSVDPATVVRILCDPENGLTRIPSHRPGPGNTAGPQPTHTERSPVMTHLLLAVVLHHGPHTTDYAALRHAQYERVERARLHGHFHRIGGKHGHGKHGGIITPTTFTCTVGAVDENGQPLPTTTRCL